MAAHPVAYSQYYIQAVEVHQPLYPAEALGLNYPEFPDSCLRALLMVAVDGGEVRDDMLNAN